MKDGHWRPVSNSFTPLQPASLYLFYLFNALTSPLQYLPYLSVAHQQLVPCGEAPADKCSTAQRLM